MDFVTRGNQIILPPTLEQILSKDFSYPDYAENPPEIELDINIDEKDTVDTKEIIELNQNWLEKILEVQRKYEQDRLYNKNLKDIYTIQMIEICHNYLNELNKIQSSKKQALQELKNNRQKLINTLNQIKHKKKEAEHLENQITNRINAYRNGEIFITDLYPIDYKYMFQRKMLTHKEIQEFAKLNLIYGFFEDLSNEEINNIIKNHSYRQIWSFIQTQEVKKHAK